MIWIPIAAGIVMTLGLLLVVRDAAVRGPGRRDN